MRLVLPFPADWSVENLAGWSRAAVPAGDGPGAMILEVGPLEPLPLFGAGEAITANLGRDLPVGSTVVVARSREARSARGWPVTIIEGQVTDAAGTVVEGRVAVVYRVLDELGPVILRWQRADQWVALGTSLVELMLAADLDWAGPPASLAEVLGLELEPAPPVRAAGPA